MAKATGNEVDDDQTAAGGHGQEALGHPQFGLQEASQIIGELSVKQVCLIKYLIEHDKIFE